MLALVLLQLFSFVEGLRICSRPHFTITSDVIFQRVDVPNAERCLERCIENMDYCSSVVHLHYRKKKMDVCVVHSVNSVNNVSVFHPDASTDPKSTVYELLTKCSPFAQSDMSHRISPAHRKLLESGVQKKPAKGLADAFFPERDRFTIDDMRFDEKDRYATMKTIEVHDAAVRDPFDGMETAESSTSTRRERPEYARPRPSHSRSSPIRPVVYQQGRPMGDSYACPGGVCSPNFQMSTDAGPCPALQGDPCAPKPRCHAESCFHVDAPPQRAPAQWSEWGPCSVTCGDGVRMRGCLDSDGSCAGPSMSPCSTGACATWTPWSLWTLCSASCGRGERQRSRICSLGRECDGPSVMVESCMSAPCPTWSPWTMWTGCSITCGTGTERRTRTCLNGLFCPGPAFEDRHCDRGPCPRWSDWSRWTECSSSCGGGEQVRNRECIDGDSCVGASEEKLLCNQQPCPAWTPWTAWSTCDDKCGEESVRLRNRICLYRGIQFAGCEGPAQDQLPCPVRECASWTEWKDWSDCSATCGQGNQMRTRSCTGGVDCAGPSNEFRFCQVAACPYWGEWSQWGGCSVTCGIGVCQRSRKCITDEFLNLPTDIGELSDEAPSDDFESDRAKAMLIARSKHIRMMGNSSEMELRRSPSRMSLAEAGTCDGPDSDKKPCDAGPCCSWDEWTEWSPCIGCGPGSEVKRTRQCSGDGGPPISMQEDPGYVHSSVNRYMTNLNIPAGLQPISPIVHRGKRQFPFRGPQCNCPGPSMETKPCPNPHPCAREPPACSWSEWGDWCGCTPCRPGREVRRRFCDRGSRPDPSCRCSGRDEEERSCEIERSCFDNEKPSAPAESNDEDRYVPIDSQINRIQVSRGRPLPHWKDETLEEQPSTAFPYPVCRWSTWSQYSDCDNETRQRHRNRFCIGNDELVSNCECSGPSTEEVDCPNPEEPSSDAPMNVVPGQGGQIKTELEFTAEGDKDLGPDLDEILKNTQTASSEDPPVTVVEEEGELPELCAWNRWSAWSDCTTSCGPGEMVRKRRCPCGDDRCGGSDTETDTCEKAACVERRSPPVFRLG